MIPEQLIRVRKEHECSGCGEVIKIGEQAYFLEGKGPKFDDKDNQVGIEFWRSWFHNYRCDLTLERRQDCEAGNHQFNQELEHDGFVGCQSVYIYTGYDICTFCGVKRPDDERST